MIITFFKKVIILLIRSYQILVSPLFPNSCRFYPSCSHYAVGAVKKYGPFHGLLRAIWRIIRCNPWNPGGYDPVM